MTGLMYPSIHMRGRFDWGAASSCCNCWATNNGGNGCEGGIFLFSSFVTTPPSVAVDKKQDTNNSTNKWLHDHITNHFTACDTYLITISGRTSSTGVRHTFRFLVFCILVFDSPTGFRFGLFPNISGSSDGSPGPRGPQPGSQITEF